MKISRTATEDLLDILEETDFFDYDHVIPILTELCERLGLDIDDYWCCDDCYMAILHELGYKEGE